MQNKILSLFVACAVSFSVSFADDLWDNGPFITGTGNGFGGADTSAVETGSNLFGANVNITMLPFRIDRLVNPLTEPPMTLL